MKKDLEDIMFAIFTIASSIALVLLASGLFIFFTSPSRYIMKKLQINFTTPEQSGRLLKIGVPAWSADCTQEKEQGGSFWQHKWIKHEWNNDYDAKDYQKFLDREKDTLPCWSVGRLMEILMICNTYFAPKVFQIEPNSMNPSLIENVVDKIEELKGYDMLDFSKLED